MIATESQTIKLLSSALLVFMSLISAKGIRDLGKGEIRIKSPESLYNVRMWD